MGITARRLLDAMERQGLDQSALARLIGSTQGAISKIILGKTTNSRLLPKIAIVLGVPLGWLLGMEDEPTHSINRSTQQPQQQLMLPVTLPSENALTDMFEGLLMAIDLDRAKPLDEVARELAQLLPTGLSQLQGRLIELSRPPRQATPPTSAAATEVPANADHEMQR